MFLIARNGIKIDELIIFQAYIREFFKIKINFLLLDAFYVKHFSALEKKSVLLIVLKSGRN
jgi:hypothetical protein